MHRTLLILALMVAVAAPARAQALKLSFNDGRVTMNAASVPVRTILNEWAKLGGTNVVGAERIAGAPLTVTLVDVPESQALDIILRSVAGYMAAPRAAAAGGASMYDRILVMATSAAPAAGAPRPSATRPGSTAGTQRFVPLNRRQAPDPDEQDDQFEEEEEDPNPPNPPVFTFPQPGQPGFAPPGLFNNGAAQGGEPPIININPVTGAPESITINPAPAPTAPEGPSTPFGTTGSAMPGVIQQPAQQPGQPREPGPMVRPPG